MARYVTEEDVQKIEQELRNMGGSIGHEYCENTLRSCINQIRSDMVFQQDVETGIRKAYNTYESENEELKEDALNLRKKVHSARKTLFKAVEWHDFKVRQITTKIGLTMFNEEDRLVIEEHFKQSRYLVSEIEELDK